MLLGQSFLILCCLFAGLAAFLCSGEIIYSFNFGAARNIFFTIYRLMHNLWKFRNYIQNQL